MQGHPFVLLGDGVVERRVLVGDEREPFEGRAELVVLESPDRHAQSLDDPIRGRDERGVGRVAREADSEQTPEDVLVDGLQSLGSVDADAGRLLFSSRVERIRRVERRRFFRSAFERPDGRLQKRELGNPLSLDPRQAITLGGSGIAAGANSGLSQKTRLEKFAEQPVLFLGRFLRRVSPLLR